jgi:hypothetical protein
MKLAHDQTNDPSRAPEDFLIYGSNDNVNWTELLSVTNANYVGSSSTIAGYTSHDVKTTTFYQYFGVVVTKISGQPNYFRVFELEYFGIPEYDPEADGVDVTVKSLPNVPNTDWLEVYYDAKNYTSGVVQDESTPQRNGTITTGVTSETVDGIKSFKFAGANNNNIISTAMSNPSGSWPHSVSVWFKRDLMANADTLFFIKNNTSGETSKSPHVKITTTGVMTVDWWDNNTSVIGKAFEPGIWYHMVYTYVGSGTHATGTNIYVDGIKQTLSAPAGGGAASALTMNGSDKIYIGSYQNGDQAFDGNMASIRVFNRALTTDEIYQLYAYQKEYFGHGVLGMTLKAGRLGIGTSEPKATLDIRGDVMIDGYRLTSMYPGFASGGDDIYDVDGYRIHVFTNSGTFVVPGRNISADVLVVGGGGGGGQDNAGGGGAGGLIFKPNHTFAGRGSSGGRDGYYVITIGSGGIGNKDQNSEVATAGNDTIIRPGRDPTGQSATYTRDDPVDIFKAVGGGPGDEASDVRPTSMNGGSGGGGQNSEGKAAPHTGGTSTQSSQSGDSGTFGYGNNGGTGVDDGGGGGGGAGTVGQNGDVLFDGAGGNGGDGYNVGDIFGTRYGEVVDEDVYFAGGGAGSNRNNSNTNFASGGKGGGGSAGATPQTIENGLPGTGGGGGGAPWETISPNNYSYNNYAGDGGSGIVIIRYRL